MQRCSGESLKDCCLVFSVALFKFMLKTGFCVYNKKTYIQVISSNFQSLYVTEIHWRAVYSKNYGWLPRLLTCF